MINAYSYLRVILTFYNTISLSWRLLILMNGFRKKKSNHDLPNKACNMLHKEI